MPSSVVVLLPFVLVMMIMFFCFFALCQHFCKDDAEINKADENRRRFLAELLRDESFSTDSNMNSNDSSIISASVNQVATISSQNSINPSTDNNMHSGAISDSSSTNTLSSTSSDSTSFDVPPFEINDTHERRNTTSLQYENLFAGIPSVYSHGSVIDSLRSNSQTRSVSVNGVIILTNTSASDAYADDYCFNVEDVTDQPPAYSEVLWMDNSETQVEHPDVTYLSESPPPSYDEGNMSY